MGAMLHDEITCPGCGYEQGDSWEASDEGEHKCERCGLLFVHLREVTVEYRTGPACPKCAADPARGRDSVPMMRSEPADMWMCWRCRGRYKTVKIDDSCTLEAVCG